MTDNVSSDFSPGLEFVIPVDCSEGAEPRCLGCGYLLTGLTEPRCPECERSFNPRQPDTFSTRPMRWRWRFWLPGLLLAGVGGGLILCWMVWAGSFGWGLTLALPFTMGVILGYGVRVPRVLMSIVVSLLLLSLLFGLIGWGLAGMLCAMILLGIIAGPIVVGTVLGAILRKVLRTTSYGRRIQMSLLALFVVPAGVTALEAHCQSGTGVEFVRTERILPLSKMQAFQVLMFYEEVTHDPPWLCRIGLPRPLYSKGHIEAVGDVKICVYDKGRLVKRVTEYVPGERLGFDVIRQQGIENRSVYLVRGSFEFYELDAGHTRVVLTTVYEPLLAARPIWRPFEKAVAHAMHGHVLDGMEHAADAARPQATLARMREPHCWSD